MDYELEELLPVIAWLTDKYTGKESGSVTYETANQLMEAALYCIGELDGGQSSGQGGGQGAGQSSGGQESTALWDTAAHTDAREAYNLGYDIAFRKVMEAKKLYGTVMKQFRAYGNRCYDETVRKGMPGFFLRYDVRFRPQDHILMLDYPVLQDLSASCGVDRILRYLTCISLEQTFLNRFPESFVRDVAAAWNPDYKSLFVNMGSTVLRHMLCCMMAGKPVTEIRFTQEEHEKIKKMTAGVTPKELEEQLYRFLKALLEQGFTGKKQLYRYLSADIPEFRATLCNAAEHNCSILPD